MALDALRESPHVMAWAAPIVLPSLDSGGEQPYSSKKRFHSGLSSPSAKSGIAILTPASFRP